MINWFGKLLISVFGAVAFGLVALGVYIHRDMKKGK